MTCVPICVQAQAHKKGEDPFAFVESDLLGDKKPSKAPAGPPPPPVPEAPLLRLMETWRGEVRGRALVRATQRGEVMCTPSLNTSSLPVVGFALAYTGPQPMSPATEAALRSTRVMQPMVRPGWPPGYVVCEGGSETGGEGDLEGFTLDVSATRGLLTPVIARYALRHVSHVLCALLLCLFAYKQHALILTKHDSGRA